MIIIINLYVNNIMNIFVRCKLCLYNSIVVFVFKLLPPFSLSLWISRIRDISVLSFCDFHVSYYQIPLSILHSAQHFRF